MPSFFIGGRNDMVIAGRPGYVEAMESMLPDYRGTALIDGAGHWTQQEAVEEFNDACSDSSECSADATEVPQPYGCGTLSRIRCPRYPSVVWPRELSSLIPISCPCSGTAPAACSSR